MEDTTKEEIIKLYDGKVTLVYDDKLHVYYEQVGDEKFVVAGVTSILATIAKPALIQWASNTCAKYVQENIKPINIKVNGEIEQFVKVADVCSLTELGRYHYKTISKDATDVGTIAHDWLEQWIKSHINVMSASNTEAVALPDNEKASNAVQAALNWMDKHKFKPINSERKIYSREYVYSGTYDWDAYITSCGDSSCCPFEGTKLALGDFKSSNNLYDEYRMQVRAYQHARNEESGVKHDLGVVLKIGKHDGEFQSWVLTSDKFEEDFTGFLGALSVYNWEQQLKLDAKKVKLSSKKPKPKKVTV